MTDLIATMGPALFDRENLREVIRHGVSGIRLSASKFSRRELADLAEIVAEAASSADRPVELLLDLPGTKTRFNNDDPMLLSGAERLRIHYDAIAAALDRNVPEIGMTGAGIGPLIEVGDVLIIGDGDIALRVAACGTGHCIAVPLTGGLLGRRKGVKVRDKVQKYESLSDADVLALREIAGWPFSSVIVSFVETPETIARVRELLQPGCAGPPAAPSVAAIVAKVETLAGAEHAAAVAQAADAVLLGRGDLLLDTGEVEFHACCEVIIRAVRGSGTPLIVGTQLLPSLSESWLANRSELAYLSHLIEQGVEGLLLSEETTRGRQPVRTVAMMAALIRSYGVRDRGEAPCPLS